MKVNKLIQLLEYSSDEVDNRALSYYHNIIRNLLLDDANKNTCNYSTEEQADLLKRYKANSWKKAFIKASKYHDVMSDLYISDSEFNIKNGKSLLKWLVETTVLGGIPKIPFSKWLKSKQQKIQLPKTTKPKVDID